MFFMDNDAKQVKRPLSIRRRLAPWVGGMLLFAIGQHLYYERIDGPYSYQVLLFEERGKTRLSSEYLAYVDGQIAPDTIILVIPDGQFSHVEFSGPIRSTKKNFTVVFAPFRESARLPTYKFEIKRTDRDRFCDLVFHVRDNEPKLIGCAGRAYSSD